MYNTCSDLLCFQNSYAGARVRSDKALRLSSNALPLNLLLYTSYDTCYLQSASCLYTEIDTDSRPDAKGKFQTLTT